ncbi:MAG: sugar phosphate isomerase/epimerase [Bacteroidales bacterium]|jgi:sugar phosphate isomerase/epimerase
MKKITFTAAILLFAFCGLFLAIFNSCKPSKNIGLQLYSIRDSIFKDVPGAIKKVGEMGYTFVEAAGYAKGKFYGMEPAAFRALCEKNGLKVLSSHTGMPAPDSANWDKVMAWWDTCISDHIAVGAKFIVQPFMGEEAYKSLDGLKKYIRYFTAVGEKCNAKGIRFGYHNHSGEFTTKLDSTIVLYDYLVQNTDPAKVMFELDIFWCTQGGGDPVALFNRYPGRFELWHIKDKKEVGESGKIDFAAIWATAPKSGMKYGIVEIEEYNFDEFTSCRKSLEFLQKQKYFVMPN